MLLFIKYIYCIVVIHSQIFKNYLKNGKKDIILIMNKFLKTF